MLFYLSAGGSGPKVSIVTPEDAFSPDRRQQQQQPSTKSRNKPQKAKKRKGFGFGSGGGEDGEQEVFQCELCNVTVNSQQQLDMHLTGKIAEYFLVKFTNFVIQNAIHYIQDGMNVL